MIDIDYEIDVHAAIADEVCSHCSQQKKLWTCRGNCPFQNYFDELIAKCADINKDANYLLSLVWKDEDEDEEDSLDDLDHVLDEELAPWSQLSMRPFFSPR